MKKYKTNQLTFLFQSIFLFHSGGLRWNPLSLFTVRKTLLLASFTHVVSVYSARLTEEPIEAKTFNPVVNEWFLLALSCQIYS